MPRRDEFLAAALARFSQFGYTATSTRDICADVGIVHSAIYNYFPSKEAVLLAIQEREMTRMQGGLDALLASSESASAEERLETALRYTFRVAINGRAAWHIMGEMLRSITPRNRVDVVRRRDIYEGTVRHLLADAIASGSLPKQDIRLSTLHIFGIAAGIAGWYRPDGQYSAEELINLTLVACMRLLGAGASQALQSDRSAIASRRVANEAARCYRVKSQR
jgi:AcrR family transcriptional regulator